MNRRTAITALAATALGASMGHAMTPETFTRGGLAISGHDPVAYFTQGAPVKGQSVHALIWNGAEWRFASAANRAAFDQDPTAYAPQFGGYCAYAVARNYTAKTEPDAWHIHEGRLYFNYNKRVRTLWRRDVPGEIARGNANWPAVLAR